MKKKKTRGTKAFGKKVRDMKNFEKLKQIGKRDRNVQKFYGKAETQKKEPD